MKRLTPVLSCLGVLWLQACGAGAPADAGPERRDFRTQEAASSATKEAEPTSQPPAGPSGPVPIGTLLDQNLTLEIVHTGGPKVEILRAGPEDQVFTIDFERETIYRLHEDDTLQEYMRFPGQQIEFFDFAPDDTLWFSSSGRDLYRVDPQGRPELIASGVNRSFDFDSAGNLFAVDIPSDNVQKITPDGKIEVIASGFLSRAIAVGPDDGVYITTFNGELAQVQTDGSLRVIATGFGSEDTPAFTPGGELYVLGWFSGLRKVDPASGQVEQQTWLWRYPSIGGKLAFDRRGAGYIFHPLLPLFRFDLETETLDFVYGPRNNSIAMAVDPLTETPYIAYGNRLPNGETILYRVAPGDTLEEIGRVPYGIETFMTFGPDGTGYLSVADSGGGSGGNAVYRFKPADGTLEPLPHVDFHAQTMAVEPATGDLWLSAGEQLVVLSPDGSRRGVPYMEGSINYSTIAFTTDGSLFASVWFRSSEPHVPMVNILYRYVNGGWVVVRDLTPEDPTMNGNVITTCPDGHVYLNPAVGEGTSRDVPGGLVRLEDDGSLSLIGYNLGGFDQLAFSCAPSGALYFTNAMGIYRVPNLGAAP